MEYSEKDDTITIEMSRDDYAQLLILLGMATGAANLDSQFWRILDFVNRMNAGNPAWRPYGIPEEFKEGVASNDLEKQKVRKAI